MAKKTAFLIFILLALIPTISALQIKFETHPEIENPFNHTYWTSLQNGSDNLIVYINASDWNYIINFTIYLAGTMTFQAASTHISGSPNTTFVVNANNNSIIQVINQTGTDSVVNNTEFYYFNFSINTPQGYEVPWNATFEFWINHTGPPTNKSYIVGVDGLIPRVDLDYPKQIKTTNRSYAYTIKANVSDGLLRKTYINIIYVNSSKYTYFDDKNLKEFMPLVYMDEYKQSVNYLNYQNITFMFNSSFFVIKNITSNKTYYTSAKIYRGEDSNLMLWILANFTNTSSQQYFLGYIMYNYTNHSNIIGILDPNGGRIINETGIKYLSDGRYVEEKGTYDKMVFNISWEKVNNNIITSNITFNMTKFVNGTQLLEKNLYDGNYSILISSHDLFFFNNTWVHLEVLNNKTPYDITTSIIEPTNNQRLLAKPQNIVFDVTDEYSHNVTCSLYVNNTYSTSINQTDTGRYTLTHDFTSSPGFYNLSIRCANDFGRYDEDHIIVEIKDVPDIELKKISISPAAYKKGDNVIIRYNVSNIGSAVANNINITFKACSDNACNNILYENYTLITSLNPGAYDETQTFNITLKDTNPKYIKISANLSGEDFNWNNQNLSVEINPKFNVSFVITSSTTNLLPGTNLTIYLDVFHFDGTPITDLGVDNITLYDFWHYVNKYRPKTIVMGRNEGNGTYMIHYSVPNITNNQQYYEYDQHKTIIEIKKENYATSNSSVIREYDIKAPFVVLTLSIPSSLDAGSTDTGKVTAKNLGRVAVDDVYILLKTSSTSRVTFNGNSQHSCKITRTLGLNEYDSCSFTLKGESEGSANIYVSAKIGNTWYNVTVSEAANYNKSIGFYSYPSKSITITVPPPTTQDQQDTQTTSTDDNTTSSQESNQEDNLKSEVTITVEKDKYTILSNETLNITIKIKNTGEKDITDMRISFVYDAKNLKLDPQTQLPQKLNKGVEKEIIISLKPITGRIGSYTIGINVKYDKEETTKQITLIVEPTEEKKREIEDMLKSLKEQLEDLEVPESLKEVYNQAKKFLDDAEKKIKEGDYVGAYSLLEQAQNNIEVISTTTQQEAQEEGGGWIIWIILGLIVLTAGGGLLYYLLTPPQSTYHPQKGYSYNPKIASQKREAYIQKLKEAISRKINK